MKPKSPESDGGPRILVVDDDESIRGLIAATLSHDNILCVGAATAEEAVRILKNQEIALTLLDWALRGPHDTSGSAVLRFSRETLPMMPVIVMSGIPMNIRDDAVMGGADGFLQKPFGLEVIRKLVGSWLKRLRNTPKQFLPIRADDILSLDEIKRTYIRHVVTLLEGNVTLAAEKLKMHRQTVASVLKGEKD